MAKSWFLDYLGKSVSPARVREICRIMELGEADTRLIIERFCHRKTMLQCDFYPEDIQKERLPDLDIQVRGWCEKNTGYFSFIEMYGITRYHRKRQAVD